MTSPTPTRAENAFTVSDDPPAIPGKVVLEKAIPSTGVLVTPLVVRTVSALRAKGLLPDGIEDKVQLCLMEALRNAVFHGNRERFERRVVLRVFLDEREWGVVIDDEGEGFDPNQVPAPTCGDSVWQESGRGLRILRHYMDRVEFYRGGRTVLFAKARAGEV